MKVIKFRTLTSSLIAVALVLTASIAQSKPAKPLLHGKHWVAITGKPLGASAGARIFYQGAERRSVTLVI